MPDALLRDLPEDLPAETLAIVEFLLARIGDEENARETSRRSLPETPTEEFDSWSWVRRSKAECRAKRSIIERHLSSTTSYPPRFDEFDPHSITVCAECGTNRGNGYKPCATLRDLASVYEDHRDYRDQWRPAVPFRTETATAMPSE